jgi:hypothetical protein
MQKSSEKHVSTGRSNTMLPAVRLKDRVLSFINSRGNGYYTAADVAREIGYPLTDGYFETCPQVRRVLTSLCKAGLLYQWITGNGLGPSGITATPKYNVNFLRRDCELAQTLISHPNRTIVGYRIR